MFEEHRTSNDARHRQQGGQHRRVVLNLEPQAALKQGALPGDERVGGHIIERCIDNGAQQSGVH
jgi:hypothetical protein